MSGAVAKDISLEKASVDAAVASLVLCSVSNPGQAIAELHRFVRPGGELRVNEHVVSQRPLGAPCKTADATIWQTLSGRVSLGA